MTKLRACGNGHGAQLSSQSGLPDETRASAVRQSRHRVGFAGQFYRSCRNESGQNAQIGAETDDDSFHIEDDANRFLHGFLRRSFTQDTV